MKRKAPLNERKMKRKDPLEELNRLATERPTHEWTPEEVRVIAGPFFESARWMNDDEVRPRVELLYRLPRQKTKGDQELCDFLIRAEKWKMQRERHRCLLRYESVSADPIYEAIKPLLKKDWTKWTDEEVAPAVEALAGLTCIVAAKSSPHALRQYIEWRRGPWHEYRPSIQMCSAGWTPATWSQTLAVVPCRLSLWLPWRLTLQLAGHTCRLLPASTVAHTCGLLVTSTTRSILWGGCSMPALDCTSGM